MRIAVVAGEDVSEPLGLLGGALREGEPLPEEFVSWVGRLVDAGDVEVLAARDGGEVVGVLVLAFRPGVSLGGPFASIEDLHVEPGSRRRGVGRGLLEAVEERCRRRGVSYVEVQTDEAGAEKFYVALGYQKEDAVRVLARSYPISGGRSS